MTLSGYLDSISYDPHLFQQPGKRQRNRDGKCLQCCSVYHAGFSFDDSSGKQVDGADGGWRRLYVRIEHSLEWPAASDDVCERRTVDCANRRCGCRSDWVGEDCSYDTGPGRGSVGQPASAYLPTAECAGKCDQLRSLYTEALRSTAQHFYGDHRQLSCSDQSVHRRRRLADPGRQRAESAGGDE